MNTILSIRIEIDDEGSRGNSGESPCDSLLKALETQTESVIQQHDGIYADDVTIETDSVNDGWEKGDRCNECGSREVICFRGRETYYYSCGGEFLEEESKDMTNTSLTARCVDCGALLFSRPVP